jgi:hypothetical protein
MGTASAETPGAFTAEGVRYRGHMARTLLALTFVLALVAGCGGGDGGGNGGGGGDAMTQDELVAEANKICREGAAKISAKTQAAQQRLEEAGDDVEKQRQVVADALEDTARDFQPYIDRLKGLEPPEDISDDWTKFVDGLGRAFELIPALADASRVNDTEELQDLLEDYRKIDTDTRPFATEYKLDDCLPENSSPTS